MSDAHGLSGLAVVAVAALVCGILFTRLRQPAIVGYIMAGVILGPSGLGLVENRAAVTTLAELGVLMLLFEIGIELNLRAVAHVWVIALAATAAQLGLSLAIMLGLAPLLGWPFELAVLLSFVMAVSSTAVAVKILEDAGELRSAAGRLALGVLIAQDLAVVPMLLTVDALAPNHDFDSGSVLLIVLAVAILTGLIWLLSRRRRLSLPFARVVTGRTELTALTALAYCFGAAALAGFAGLSSAFGAFLAGLVIGSSSERAIMLSATKPIQSVLLMVFFLSIGLLIDVDYIWRELGTVILLMGIVTLVKTALNVAILHAMRVPWQRAFLAGTVLGQLGEFSFVLVAAGVARGLIDDEGERMMVALIALSLIISPLWLLTARRLNGLATSGVAPIGQLLGRVYGVERGMLARLTRRWRGAAPVKAEGAPAPAADGHSESEDGTARSQP
ncbi:MAG: cation:proton antiporter [Alphaproteobacteria bacterium]|nr:cation:proton antiporter [Alphaproteobacteria bacterium]